MICAICGREYPEARRKKNYCSMRCVFESVRRPGKKTMRILVNPRKLPVPHLKPTKPVRIDINDGEYDESWYSTEQAPRGLSFYSGAKDMKNPGSYTPEEEEIILRMHKEGATNTAIAKKLDRTPFGIRNKIDRMRWVGRNEKN